ncbi:MAG: hypothetical protein K8L91_00655 [Anaerolineae bacterium]|nr:hypothetical protein [Anaerolineae bacterium]
MNTPDRLIDRLTLRATDEAHVRRGVLLIEDALRTASLPNGFGGKLVIIRALNLGKISTESSPTKVSLQLERTLREVWAMAVHAGSPSAEFAPAVYFHDDVEPYILLATRVLQHQPVSGWFWANAVPTWQPHRSPHEMLRGLVYDVMETRAGIVGVGALLTTLADMGLVDGLLTCLHASDGPLLSQHLGWSNAACPDKMPHVFLRARARPLPINRRDAALWMRWLKRWGPKDDRLAWLIGTTVIAQHPVYAQAAEFDWQIAATLNALIQTEAPLLDEDVEPYWVSSNTSQSPDFRAPTHLLVNEPPQDSHTANDYPVEVEDYYPSALKDSADSAAPNDTIPSEQPDFDAPIFSPAWGTPQPTAFAGLFLLLPLLNHLGIGEWLDAHPMTYELDFPARLLHFCAARLGAAPDDPVRLALPTLNPIPPEINDFEFALPAHWADLAQPGRILQMMARRAVVWDGSERLALAVWHDTPSTAVEAWLSADPMWESSGELDMPDLDLVLNAWLVVMRRWLRRFVSIGLYDLIRRPGQIAFTRTHLDIFWDGRMADMRIRRAGLDLDPGWVAWLGRVVQFHYLFDDDQSGQSG